jgi:hypothetical protein
MTGRIGTSALALVAAALVFGGCGGSGGGSAASNTTTTSAAATVPRNAIYEITGTQTCKSAQGPGTVDLAIFPGSFVQFAGGTATVNLRNEAVPTKLTRDGQTFRAHEDFDLSGTPVSTAAARSSTVLPLDLSGTVTADGRTISGHGSDAGVNCTYEFSGRRVSSLPTTTTVPTTAPPPTTAAPMTAPPTTVTSAAAVPQSCDRAAVLAKTIALHPDTLLRTIGSVQACGGGWAVVSWGTGDFDSNQTLKWSNGQWVEATPADNVCGTPGVPQDVHLYACEVG